MGTVDPGPIRLVVAAESREFRGILRNCGPVEPLDWPAKFCVSAVWQGVRWVFAANGPGPRLVARLLRAVELNAGEAGFDAVISTGYCGALDPQLQLGDIVEATRVSDATGGREYDVRQVSGAKPGLRGIVLSQDRVAVTAQEKSDLRGRTGAAVVEMEAGAVAFWASTRGLPFYCLRVVSDAAAESIALDMNEMRDEDGRFDRWKIARAAMARPFTRVPSLVRFHHACRLAENQLGEFFANCRFE